jgi:hypothetical protein
MATSNWAVYASKSYGPDVMAEYERYWDAAGAAILLMDTCESVSLINLQTGEQFALVSKYNGVGIA